MIVKQVLLLLFLPAVLGRVDLEQRVMQLTETVEKLQQQIIEIREENFQIKEQNNAVSEKNAALEEAIHTTEKAASDSIAFTAYTSTDASYLPGDTVTFDSVITNTGAAYDPTTSIFTVPVSGLYSFTVSMTSKTGANAEVTIMRNAVETGNVLAGDGALNSQSSITLALECTAGDVIYVEVIYAGNSVRGSRYTLFTGQLLALSTSYSTL